MLTAFIDHPQQATDTLVLGGDFSLNQTIQGEDISRWISPIA
jgi:hypothetical protein